MKVYVAVLGFQGCIEDVKVHTTMAAATKAVIDWTGEPRWFDELAEHGCYPDEKYDPSNAYECTVAGELVAAGPQLEAAQEATRFLLGAISGFPESSLYDDYKEIEGFTDREWDEATEILSRFSGG